MEFFEFFAGFEGAAGYVIVLVTLIACGLGVPVPEDVILISGGYVAQAAGHGVVPMMVTGLVGIMAGDSMIYGFGRRFGMQLAAGGFISRFVTPERLVKVTEMFDKHGEKILIAARFMPGVRAVAFFSAGAMKVPFWKFFLFDGLAALVSAPLWVYLGFRFGPHVVEWAKQFQWALGALVVVAIAVFFVRRAMRKKAPVQVTVLEKRPAATPSPPGVES